MVSDDDRPKRACRERAYSRYGEDEVEAMLGSSDSEVKPAPLRALPEEMHAPVCL
jgi:hypothetical protein